MVTPLKVLPLKVRDSPPSDIRICERFSTPFQYAMNKILFPLGILAISISASAGDWGKAPVEPSPIEECVDLGSEISFGYLTDYYFFGVRYSGDSVWTDLNYTFDGLAVPITVGAFYLNGTNGESPAVGNFDELDLYVNGALGTFAGFDVELGYTHYTFPGFRTNAAPFGGYGEAGLDLRRSLGVVDLTFATHYAFGGGGIAPSGWFHELGVEKTFTLTDSIGLTFGGGIGYSDGYLSIGGMAPNRFSPRSSGWNHYFVNVSVPIQLNCRTTLTPHLSYVGAPDTFIADGIFASDERQSDQLVGGITLSVSF
jgi:hypothetical protein